MTPDIQPRPIRFVHNGRIVETSPANHTRTVLEWLREDAACTGTKEGCAEGDCGACTVIVAELAEQGAASGARTAHASVVGGLSLRPVNACIRFLPTLDGKALFTVEDVSALGAAATPAPMTPCASAIEYSNGLDPTPSPIASAPIDALHPVQRALVEHHGSQCGFCTPGFVMTMTAAYERHQEAGTVPTRRQLADELSGNLCRCTGYRPILDAGQQMFELPPLRLDTKPVVAMLKQLRDAAPLRHIDRNGCCYTAPRSVDALADLLNDKPHARLLAGCTDIGLWVNKQFRELGDIVYVGEIDELKLIEVRDGALRIGAAASLEDAWCALHDHWPTLQEAWTRFAGPPTRHAGTMGGNVANGSPIGDSPPVLIALGAEIVLRKGGATREMPLEDFYLDYMKNRLEPGEFVQAIRVPLPTPNQRLRAYKISKRYDCDISALFAALAIELDGDTVRCARFAFGGMAAVVKRAARAEAAVIGQPWNEATLNAAKTALDADFEPMTDLRASAEYRTRVARGLLERLWLETRRSDALAPAAVSVWAAAAA